MSVIPYNSQNKLVYHDPYTQVAIILDRQNQTVRLLETPHRWGYRNSADFESTSATCPQCGFDLRGFFEPGKSKRRASFSSSHFSPDFPDESPSFRRDLETPISNSSLAPASEYLGTLGGTYFMHRDYFKLLSSLNHDLRLAYSGELSNMDSGGDSGVDSGGDSGADSRRDSRISQLVSDRVSELPGVSQLISDGVSDFSDGFKQTSSYSREKHFGNLDQRLPPDLFNQGYFSRFFQKVPPFVLGSGAHAHVYKVQHVLKNISLGLFAVKRINVGDHSKYLEHVLNEVLILYEVSANGATANNLIRYNHVWMELGDLHDSGTFIVGAENSESHESTRIPYVYILQQYCAGGNLETMISEHYPQQEHMTMRERVEMERRRRKRKGSQPDIEFRRSWLSDIEIWKFFHDIANGVHYLHENQILHRDLKPSNCLLETAYTPSSVSAPFRDRVALDEYLGSLPRVVVSDFGEGKFIDKSKKPEIRMGNTGTVEFADPKLWIYDSVKNYTHAFTYSCDMYSLALIMCYLCVGSSPFSAHISGLDDPEMVRSVISTWYDNLAKPDFFRWLKTESIRVRGQYTDCTKDLGTLAYSMLIGEADSKTVLQQLETLTHHFLHTKPQSGLKETMTSWRISHMRPLMYILNFILLEYLDIQRGSYLWKILKAMNLIGIIMKGGSKVSIFFFVLIVGAGIGQDIWI